MTPTPPAQPEDLSPVERLQMLVALIDDPAFLHLPVIQRGANDQQFKADLIAVLSLTDAPAPGGGEPKSRSEYRRLFGPIPTPQEIAALTEAAKAAAEALRPFSNAMTRGEEFGRERGALRTDTMSLVSLDHMRQARTALLALQEALGGLA